MIRKLYFLLAFIALSVTAFAQRVLDFELLETRIGTGLTPTKIAPNQKILFDGKTKYSISWWIINHGPDSLKKTDSFMLKSSNGVTYKGPMNTTVTSPDTIVLSPSVGPQPFNIPAGITPPLVVTIPWCDSIWIAAGPGNTALIDPDMSNNYFCENIQANYAYAVGINTVTDEADGFLLYPNPANDKLNVRFDFDNAKGVGILLRNTIGQIVYDHEVGDYSGTLTKTIDISNLPPGMYTAELHYNDQTIVSKVMIQ